MGIDGLSEYEVLINISMLCIHVYLDLSLPAEDSRYSRG
jgi:hypothetical protein